MVDTCWDERPHVVSHHCKHVHVIAFFLVMKKKQVGHQIQLFKMCRVQHDASIFVPLLTPTRSPHSKLSVLLCHNQKVNEDGAVSKKQLAGRCPNRVRWSRGAAMSRQGVLSRAVSVESYSMDTCSHLNAWSTNLRSRYVFESYWTGAQGPAEWR